MAGGATRPDCRFWQLWALAYESARAEAEARARKRAERRQALGRRR